MIVDSGFVGQDLCQLLATFFAGWLIFQLAQRALVPSRQQTSPSTKLAYDDAEKDADNEAEEVVDSDSEFDYERSAAAAARGLLDRLRPPPPHGKPPPPPTGLLDARPANHLINVCLDSNQALDELQALLSDFLKSD